MPFPSGEMIYLVWVAGVVGVIHTVLGPDHYLPFVAMARAGKWTNHKTLWITTLCGLAHVGSSVALGLIGVAVGLAIGVMESAESARGEFAGWLLVGFGVAYTAWGVRQAVRHRPHSHWHTHGDGTCHIHAHDHIHDHAHVHDQQNPARAITPWVLFTIFIFGPCEPLIPILIYPAAKNSWIHVGLVVGMFTAATLVTMISCVFIGLWGLSGIRWKGVERYSHVLAGLAVTACGVAIKLGL
jgi:sulfite exporter TauE/SafE